MEWASTLLRRNVAVSGHRVLFVDEVGPGALAGLVPFLDLITAVAGETLNDTDKTLAAVIRQFENSSVELTVYSCKTMTYRTTSLTPTRDWGGPGILGIVARYDSLDVKQAKFMVTCVLQGGPAAEAGLKPFDDYILGSDKMSVHCEDDVASMLLSRRRGEGACAGESIPEAGEASGDTSAATTPEKPRGEGVLEGSHEPSEHGVDGGDVDSSMVRAAGGSPMTVTLKEHPEGRSGAASPTDMSLDSSKDEVLVLYVYNAPTDTVRTIGLIPSRVPLAPPEVVSSAPISATGSSSVADAATGIDEEAEGADGELGAGHTHALAARTHSGEEGDADVADAHGRSEQVVRVDGEESNGTVAAGAAGSSAPASGEPESEATSSASDVGARNGHVAGTASTDAGSELRPTGTAGTSTGRSSLLGGFWRKGTTPSAASSAAVGASGVEGVGDKSAQATPERPKRQSSITFGLFSSSGRKPTTPVLGPASASSVPVPPDVDVGHSSTSSPTAAGGGDSGVASAEDAHTTEHSDASGAGGGDKATEASAAPTAKRFSFATFSKKGGASVATPNAPADSSHLSATSGGTAGVEAASETTDESSAKPGSKPAARSSAFTRSLASIGDALSGLQSNISNSSSFKVGVASLGTAAAKLNAAVISAADIAAKSAVKTGKAVHSATTKPKSTTGTWYDYVGVRIHIVSTLPHMSTAGRAQASGDGRIQDADARDRLVALGVDDLFLRLTGSTASALLAIQRAAAAEAAAHARSSTSTSVDHEAGSDEGHGDEAHRHTHSKGATAAAGAASATGGGDESEDSEEERARASRGSLKPPRGGRRTRGALKRASETAARNKARVMGMSLYREGSEESAPSSAAPSHEVDAGEAVETTTGGAAPTESAAPRSGIRGMFGSRTSEAEVLSGPVDMPLWQVGVTPAKPPTQSARALAMFTGKKAPPPPPVDVNKLAL